MKVKILSCMMIPYLSWLYLFIVTYFRLMYSSNLWSYRHLELASVDVISSYFAVEVQRTHKLHVFHIISTLLIKVSLIKSIFFCVGLGVQIMILCRLLSSSTVVSFILFINFSTRVQRIVKLQNHDSMRKSQGFKVIWRGKGEDAPEWGWIMALEEDPIQGLVKWKGLGLNLVQNLPWKHSRDMQKILSSNTSEKWECISFGC